MAYDAIYPGRVWLDTNGNRIQAHGGSLFYENGTYYWYGENKEKTDGKNGIWHWGVRCYASKDLYNWEDLGLIIEPEVDDPASSLHPSAQMDRPHIIYNAKTKKYVCWLKIMGSVQTETILTADAFLGPYTKVREGLTPLGMSAGDFDLAVGEDGRAYYYFEKVHTETICADLTEDYTDVAGTYTSHVPHPHPPYVREATAHFQRKGKHYLITSGTTGYLPNPSEVAVGEDFHGSFRVLGDPHPGDTLHYSFHSQIASVFKVPGKKDLYIACADRWVPDFDLKAVPGVTHLVLALGINDIIHTQGMMAMLDPAPAPSVEEFGDACREIARLCREGGIRTVAFTIYPASLDQEPETEARLLPLYFGYNDAIRAAGFDHVVETEAILGRKDRHGYLDGVCKPDGLHLSPEGGRILGNAIPLEYFAVQE